MALHKEDVMLESNKVDFDQESGIEDAKERTMYNSIQDTNPKDVLINTDAPSRPVFSKLKILFLAYQSIGVIYGDLGTSPLYTFSGTFTSTPDREDVLGALSMIIWTLTLVVCVKYCGFVLSADDNGEGGTFALYSLLSRYANITWNNPNAVSRAGFNRYPTGDIKNVNRSVRTWIEDSIFLRHLINLLAIVGVCMVIADGILTPAQTVLGAVQGLRIQAPGITDAMRTGITEVILIFIFLVQPFGTTKIAVSFAPIVSIWLLLNLACGIYNCIYYDATVFQAFSPYWIYRWFAKHGADGWKMMGGTLLSITGVEALYADLGHFDPTAVRISWLLFAYPCILMAYIGQSAYLVMDTTGEAWSNSFYASVPPQAFWFAFIMGLLAAIVASQAMISACFSILSQAMTLSCFPQLKVVHTSRHYQGQVYIPMANYLLMIGTVAVAGGFQNTTSLGNAYGACVIATAFVTTILMTLLSIIVWRWNVVFALVFLVFFGIIDGAYLTSALRKVPDGAWFTVVLGAVLAMVMGIWRYGSLCQWDFEDILKKNLRKARLVEDTNKPLDTLSTKSFAQKSDMLMVVFDPAGFDLPSAFEHMHSTLKVEPSVVIFCHVRRVNTAMVQPEERFIVFREPTRPLMYRVILRQGYKDLLPETEEELGILLSGHIINLVESLDEAGAIANARDNQITYLSSTSHIVAKPGSFFLKRAFIELYAWLKRNTMENQQALYSVPMNKSVLIGMQCDL
ncbi:potassium transporter [Lichtheimia corymbifera JMRC:FSU:9682]|uniref:Potassium transporter n=1 Tax=Lichtheimia corymbifera JMRC:FSU:9682 TaxID=1263082 RepID=A0A068RIN0_9FUNG|nr:potassium transporter [Lichtheimia corymbifera JMRC:FSU:9682]